MMAGGWGGRFVDCGSHLHRGDGRYRRHAKREIFGVDPISMGNHCCQSFSQRPIAVRASSVVSANLRLVGRTPVGVRWRVDWRLPALRHALVRESITRLGARFRRLR
uniref:Uncharacterized protein n=1 Tax=Plectus sambesii TaxID=2011161 RepID=A0A914UZ13_9BILA